LIGGIQLILVDFDISSNVWLLKNEVKILGGELKAKLKKVTVTNFVAKKLLLKLLEE
jgi:hypothetical protein